MSLTQSLTTFSRTIGIQLTNPNTCQLSFPTTNNLIKHRRSTASIVFHCQDHEGNDLKHEYFLKIVNRMFCQNSVLSN